MDKETILAAIREIAARNGGRPPGADRFRTESGIAYGAWYGVFWARWSDAVREAGLPVNAMTPGYDETFMLRHFAGLVRKMGRVPTAPEMDVERRADPALPCAGAYRKRFGGKLGAIDRLRVFCETHAEYRDVAQICRAALEPPAVAPVLARKKPPDPKDGTVYLIRTGRFHKIGRTNCMGRRERELFLQMPERTVRVHTIATDDAVGVERYWHRRFAAQRRHGEFFALEGEHIRAFKRWKKI